MNRIAMLGCSFALAAASSLWGHGLIKKNLPPCEPGYQWVEEICYKDVERDVCKIVPDVIKHKKIVYTTKDDPFCIPHDGKNPWHAIFKRGLGHGHGCNTCKDGACEPGKCPSCDGPYCRKQLVKKEIVCEEPTTKCVVEKVVERVQYTVLKKVPCTTIPECSTPGVPTAPPAHAAPEQVAPPAQPLPKSAPK